MQATENPPVTLGDCDKQLRRLVKCLAHPGLAEYERAIIREEIDEWLECRLLCQTKAA